MYISCDTHVQLMGHTCTPHVTYSQQKWRFSENEHREQEHKGWSSGEECSDISGWDGEEGPGIHVVGREPYQSEENSRSEEGQESEPSRRENFETVPEGGSERDGGKEGREWDGGRLSEGEDGERN